MRFTLFMSVFALASACTQDFEQYGFGGGSAGSGASAELGGATVEGGSSAGGNANGGASTNGGASANGGAASGGSSAQGGSSQNGGGGAGGPTVEVACDGAVCINQVCCFNNGRGSAHCDAECIGDFAAARCDGPEDCPGALCCGDESGTKCAPTCDGASELCTGDNCSDGTCTDSLSGLPNGYMVCDKG